MISKFFIDRPIFATVLSVIITLVGGIALFTLPVAQYPRITPPSVQVSISYPGASAQVVADTVAAPIEQEVTGVPGMLYMSSQSGNDGSYSLSVTFDVSIDLNTALVMVQNRVTLALPLLPSPVQKQGITIRKKTPDMLMIISFFSPDGRYDDLFLSNYAMINIRDELLRVEGVSDVNLQGQRDYSIRAWLDPQKLASRNLTASDVANAIRGQNIEAAPGQVGQPPSGQGTAFQLPINVLGRLQNPEQFGDIILYASDHGPSPSLVRLRDVARVEMGAQNYNQSCTFDGKPAVGVTVYQLPGTNALDVADNVRAKMEELKTRFPEGLTFEIGYDTTPYISESVNEVFHTLRDAVIVVALVVLVFLQDWKAMVLPMIDVPVSLIGTFAVMAALGFSLNNISLFGLVLAIGIVVDDAIVVLESIERLISTGLDARTATIRAMEEISGPIMAITLVLCAVFVPCAFISGITGRFFRQFAVTIAVSTIISAINAITMTPSRALLIFQAKESQEGRHEHKREALPWWIFGFFGGMLSVWLIPKYLDLRAMDLSFLVEKPAYWKSALLFAPGLVVGLGFGWMVIRPVNAVLGAFFRFFNAGFDYLTAWYGWTVGYCLRLSVLVLIGYGGLLVVTYFVFQSAPTGFVPQQDMGRLVVSIQLPDSSSLQRTQEALARVEKITRATPGVAHTIGICGVSFLQQASSPNFGSLFVILDPFEKRQSPKLRDEAIMKHLRREWAKQVQDCQVLVFGSSPIPGVSVAGGFKVVVEDKAGLGLPTLQDQTERMVRRVKELSVNGKPALTGVSSQFRSNTPQLFMDIDRAKAAALDVAFEDINQTCQIYLGSLYVNSFNQFGRHWQVTLQAEGQFRDQVSDISLLQVRNRSGQMVPLGTLVTMREINGPIFVQRFNLSTSAPIVGSLAPGISSGDVIDGVNQLSTDTLPRTMKTEWTELMFMQIKEGNSTIYVFALAVLCVFLALSALYESWTLPLAVILVVPLCVLCSVAGVLYTNTSVNIFVQIGLVVLVGLACKNAILIVEYSKQLHQEGQTIFDATKTASKLRLRPILMTSFAFILGVVPLVLASGAGAEMRRSLGTAVFSGMLGVTFFGIFLTPVFFYVIQGFGETSLFSSSIFRWLASGCIGLVVGLGMGFLLGKLEAVPEFWGTVMGGCAGLVIAIAAQSIRTWRQRP